MLSRHLVRAAVAVAAAAAMVAVTAPAHASTIDVGVSVSVSVPTSTPNPDDGLDGAFRGSPAALLQGILCPVVTAVSGATSGVPGVGPILDQLPGIVCAISVAGYVYRTTYLPPSGPPVVRYTRALLGIPTPIDVDGAGLPDYLGTVGLALPGLSLQVSRFAWFPASARVSIEAVAIVPGAANTYVGFGEDGTAAGTANNWNATLTVAGLSSTTADLNLNIGTNQAPSSLGVLGELFSGTDPDAPDHVYRGNAGFTPVPASFNTRLVASQDRQEVIVSSTPTTLNAKVDVLSPGRAQKINAVADQLPSSIDVVHATAGTTDTTTYDANAPIAKVTGSYRDTVNGNLVTAAALDAWGVPQHIKFEQASEKTTVGATSGKIDRIQARFARGSDVGPLDPGTAPFARFHRTTASNFTAGLQVSNLKSVSINQSAPYGGELVFANAPGLFPFTADDDTSSLHLEGSLSNLPLDTTVGVDLANGVVSFDGHGTGIDKIAVKATRPAPFFTRVTRLDATLENLPASEVINVAQAAGTMSATASNPLGAITLLASDGSAAPAISGSGASYDDTPGLYRAFLRLSGLKSVSFQGDPVIGDVQTSQSQFFTVKGNTSGIAFDGTISNLPAHMTFAMKPGAAGAKVVDFDSHGESITKITANGTGLPAPAGMPNFEAVVENLPSHLTVTLPAANGNVVFDAHGSHVGRVYAQAWGGSKASIPAGEQKLEYVDGQHVAANLLQIGSAEVSTSASPFRIKYDIAAQPLDFLVKVPDVDLTGSVVNPQPATVRFQPFDKDTDGEGGVKINYNVDPANHTGDGSIDHISVVATIGSAFIHANVANIPANLDICLQTDDGTLCKPSWTPGVQGYTVVPPSFAAHFFPTDLTGHVPATPVVVNGRICPDIPTEGACNGAGQRDKHVVIDDLKFKTLEAAFGSHDEGCDIACGTVWAEASTFGPGSPSEGDHVNGRVQYYDGGDNGDTSLVDLDLKPDASFIALNRLFFFLHYDAFSTDPLDWASSGTLACGDDPNLTIGLNNLPDPDILNGTFGVC
ncbi:hypothetical protein ACVW00_001941 [Marmoricola sp. URHA0025 HA25]